MPIRRATYADLLAAAQVTARAFWDEELFGQRIHIHRNKYPAEVYLFYLRQLRKDYFDARTVVLVSYSKDLPDSVTGVGVWTRKGHGGNVLAASQSWSSWFTARFLIPVYNYLEAVVYPNRAADSTKLDILDRAAPFTAHYWTTPERTENWYLALCGTGPEFQGKGYGKELVMWGVERAKEEGVCASLVSANGKDGFYRKCGVTEHVGAASEGGPENPIHDIPGGMILFTKKFEKQ